MVPSWAVTSNTQSFTLPSLVVGSLHSSCLPWDPSFTETTIMYGQAHGAGLLLSFRQNVWPFTSKLHFSFFLIKGESIHCKPFTHLYCFSIWIFVVQFGTVIVYFLIFLHLKNTLTTILPSSHSTTHAKVDRAARLMLMFPLAYIILTLPLSAGRMWSMAHHTYNIHEGYQLASGALIACSGMVDCLLYTLTRRSLVQSTTSSENKSTTSGLDSYDLSRLNGITQTRTVTVTGDRVSTISSTTRVSDDDDAYSMRTISTSPRKKQQHHLREPARTHSPTSSIDNFIGVEGLDPRKPTHKVQISTYEARTSEDVDSLRDSERSESPVNVMRGLAKMVKLPNLVDRK